MAAIRPFRGVRFDTRRVPLSAALCPPYDVISAPEAARLRRGRDNAVHLELPEGEGASKYRRAASVWKSWRAKGALLRDDAPAFYACEERFRQGGRTLTRVGFLAALSVKPANKRFVLPHERTLPKAKADRLRLLGAVKANISPIFGIFPDPSGAARRALARARARTPAASGRLGPVAYRLWTVSDPALVSALTKALAPRTLLIADGHHRYEVSRRYYEKVRLPEADSVLAYLCPEEDPGLVVLPTHRVVSGAALRGRAEALCRLKPCRSQAELLSRLAKSPNPYAFGLYAGIHAVAEPVKANGCRSGLGVEWLGEKLLSGVSPEAIGYTPDAARAKTLARERGGEVVYVKPFPVSAIRKAVGAVGLLPPKSTYFYPKVATGLVFRPLEKE